MRRNRCITKARWSQKTETKGSCETTSSVTLSICNTQSQSTCYPKVHFPPSGQFLPRVVVYRWSLDPVLLDWSLQEHRSIKAVPASLECCRASLFVAEQQVSIVFLSGFTGCLQQLGHRPHYSPESWGSVDRIEPPDHLRPLSPSQDRAGKPEIMQENDGTRCKSGKSCGLRREQSRLLHP